MKPKFVLMAGAIGIVGSIFTVFVTETFNVDPLVALGGGFLLAFFGGSIVGKAARRDQEKK